MTIINYILWKHSFVYIFLIFLHINRQGESHKRFSQYFNQSSEQSSGGESDTSASTDPPAKKLFTETSSAKASSRNSIQTKFRGAKDSQESDEDESSSSSQDDDDIFMPSSRKVGETAAILSESEPEDEGIFFLQILRQCKNIYLSIDAVRKHQEKLEARKSRINSNMSALPINKTHNLTSAFSKLPTKYIF